MPIGSPRLKDGNHSSVFIRPPFQPDMSDGPVNIHGLIERDMKTQGTCRPCRCLWMDHGHDLFALRLRELLFDEVFKTF